MNELKEYIKRQNNSGIEVGDMVKVTRIAKSHEEGWSTMWIDDMDNYVGKTCRVVDISERGIQLVDDKNAYFPFFILSNRKDKIKKLLE